VRACAYTPGGSGGKRVRVCTPRWLIFSQISLLDRGERVDGPYAESPPAALPARAAGGGGQHYCCTVVQCQDRKMETRGRGIINDRDRSPRSARPTLASSSLHRSAPFDAARRGRYRELNLMTRKSLAQRQNRLARGAKKASAQFRAPSRFIAHARARSPIATSIELRRAVRAPIRRR